MIYLIFIYLFIRKQRKKRRQGFLLNYGPRYQKLNAILLFFFFFLFTNLNSN